MLRSHSATRDDQVLALIQKSRFAFADWLAVCEEGFISRNLVLLGWTRASQQISVISQRGVVLLLFVVDLAEEEGAAGEDGVVAGDVALDAAGGRVVEWGACGI